MQFAVGGQGIVNFLIYGLMQENVTLWFKTFGALVRARHPLLLQAAGCRQRCAVLCCAVS
jgi:hypothetical protein